MATRGSRMEADFVGRIKLLRDAETVLREEIAATEADREERDLRMREKMAKECRYTRLSW